jgi:hypothetical protein
MAYSFTITVSGQTFDSKSAEVAFIQKTLQAAAQEIGQGRGTVVSGSIIGVNPTGVPNSSLGSWSYTPGATRP